MDTPLTIHQNSLHRYRLPPPLFRELLSYCITSSPSPDSLPPLVQKIFSQLSATLKSYKEAQPTLESRELLLKWVQTIANSPPEDPDLLIKISFIALHCLLYDSNAPVLPIETFRSLAQRWALPFFHHCSHNALFKKHYLRALVDCVGGDSKVIESLFHSQSLHTKEFLFIWEGSSSVVLSLNSHLSPHQSILFKLYARPMSESPSFSLGSPRNPIHSSLSQQFWVEEDTLGNLSRDAQESLFKNLLSYCRKRKLKKIPSNLLGFMRTLLHHLTSSQEDPWITTQCLSLHGDWMTFLKPILSRSSYLIVCPCPWLQNEGSPPPLFTFFIRKESVDFYLPRWKETFDPQRTSWEWKRCYDFRSDCVAGLPQILILLLSTKKRCEFVFRGLTKKAPPTKKHLAVLHQFQNFLQICDTLSCSLIRSKTILNHDPFPWISDVAKDLAQKVSWNILSEKERLLCLSLFQTIQEQMNWEDETALSSIFFSRRHQFSLLPLLVQSSLLQLIKKFKKEKPSNYITLKKKAYRLFIEDPKATWVPPLLEKLTTLSLPRIRPLNPETPQEQIAIAHLITSNKETLKDLTLDWFQVLHGFIGQALNLCTQLKVLRLEVDSSQRELSLFAVVLHNLAPLFSRGVTLEIQLSLPPNQFDLFFETLTSFISKENNLKTLRLSGLPLLCSEKKAPLESWVTEKEGRTLYIS